MGGLWRYRFILLLNHDHKFNWDKVMKTQQQIIQRLALLALFSAFNARLSPAHAGDMMLLGKTNQTQTIPWGQVGAKAGVDYQGDGLRPVFDSSEAVHKKFPRIS